MRAVVVFFLSAAAALGASTAINISWLPITDFERQLKAPVVEKDSGVEALFWRVHVMDQVQGEELERVLYHYVRLKIFNQDGKDKVATIDIRYPEKTYISLVSGRSIQPDGSIVELSKDAIHQRIISRAGGLKQNATSFALPGVEVGSIVEYRWKETRVNTGIMYLPLQLQREYPVQRVTYLIRPLPWQYSAGYRLSVRPFGCIPSPLTMDNDGFNVTYVEHVPAFREEPMMPGESGIRQWLLVYYHTDNDKREPEKYWSNIGKKTYDDLKQSLKLNGELKQAAASAVEGAKTDEEKVVALIRYIHGNMRELFDRSVTDAERGAIIRKMPKGRERTSTEVFKSGIGTADELNTLFAALAAEAGLDARPALLSSRSDFLFDERLTERYFLRNIDMAVLINGKWKLYDVSTGLLYPGMLVWQEEGARALITDPKQPHFISAPISPPEASQSLRTGQFELAADGALEGDVTEAWTGHTAHEQRTKYSGESAERQLERVKEEIMAAWPNAEIDKLHVENADKGEQPLKVGYHIKVPGYAQRTGKRMFLQPLFFERNSTPLFTAAERRYDIHFRHAWREFDQVNISLPEGFELEKADNPGGMNFGPSGSYILMMSIRAGRELQCRRELVFGAGEQLFFPRDAYKQLKFVFDEINTRDKHTLALKQAAQ